MATVYYKKLQGIPRPGVPFKLQNFQTGRFLFNDEENTLFLKDTDNSKRELFFELIPAEGNNRERYLIRSVNTNSVIADNGDGKGDKSGLEVQDEDRTNSKQMWSIEPSSTFPTGYYRLKNRETNAYLFNGKSEQEKEGFLRTLKTTGDENETQNWTFIFTEGLGIPPVFTEIRIRNDKTKRIVFTNNTVVYLQDAVTTRKDQVFMLVPSTLHPESYLIQSVNTGGYLEDLSNGTAKSDGLEANSQLDQSSQRQVWTLVPATTVWGTYRIQNSGTKAYLLNGTPPSGPGHYLRTLKGTTENHDQCWSLLDN